MQDLEPQLVVSVMLCTVRECTSMDMRNCFEIISPNRRVYILQAETEDDMKSWMRAIQAYSCFFFFFSSSAFFLSLHFPVYHGLLAFCSRTFCLPRINEMSNGFYAITTQHRPARSRC